jgi:hypothetical protein
LGTWLIQVCLVEIRKVDGPLGIGVAANNTVFRGVEAQVRLVAYFAESLNHLLCETRNAGFAEQSVKYSHDVDSRQSFWFGQSMMSHIAEPIEGVTIGEAGTELVP